MNIITHSITQPTADRFDYEARCRWEGEGGLQQPPFDRGLPWIGSGWPLRIGMAGILRRMTASFAVPLDWLVSSDGRFARDTRELFGIPSVDRNARFRERLHRYRRVDDVGRVRRSE